MKSKAGLVLEKYNNSSSCKHHWLIEPPNGPFSRGKCKHCDTEKLFDNILADLLAPKDISEPVASDDPEGGTNNLETTAS